MAEAFGLTKDTSPYVYLSDGGHFENLGLYEMVLRRCHYIVVSDAGKIRPVPLPISAKRCARFASISASRLSSDR